MTHSAKLVAAVVAAKGRKSCSTLAAEHGLTCNAIIGIWRRHAPKPMPEPAGDATPTALDLRTAVVTGRTGAVWRALLDAGECGASADEIRDRIHAGRPVPRTWPTSFYACMRQLRDFAERHGYTVAQIPGARPKRWRACAAGDLAAPAGVEPAPVVLPPPPVPLPVAVPEASRPRLPGTVLKGLAGAAAAVAASEQGKCRWPLGGHPHQASFHFCGAPARDGKPYCVDHARVASAGLWHPRRVA